MMVLRESPYCPETDKVVIIINGTGGAGKDTFCEFAAKHYYVRNVSSIDPIKTLARAAGWDGRKDAKSRKLLSDLKGLFTEYNDLAFSYICEQHDSFIASSDEDILFVHIREPEEIARFDAWVKEQEKARCMTLLVDRKDGRKSWGNASDDGVDGYPYSYVYHNDLSLEEAEADAMEFLKMEILGIAMTKKEAYDACKCQQCTDWDGRYECGCLAESSVSVHCPKHKKWRVKEKS